MAMDWTARVWLPAVQDFSLLHSIQTDCEAHPASHSMGTMGSFSGVKRKGREADPSPPSSAELKKSGAIPQLSHMSSWHNAELIKHRDNFKIFPSRTDLVIGTLLNKVTKILADILITQKATD
jgi:hypothetical protein